MRAPDATDALGAGLVTAVVAWTIVSAAASGGNPWPAVGIGAGATCAYVLARLVATRYPWGAPLAVVVTAGALALGAGRDAWSGRAHAAPLGYANADGALWVQAVAAATLLALATTSIVSRAVAAGLAVAFAALTLATGSLAASVLLGLVVVAALVSRSTRAVRWFVVGAALLVGASFWTTFVLGAGYQFQVVKPPSQEVAEESLSTRRLVLWRDAVDLMKANPVTGVGPRRFGAESQIALADPDTTETHNEFLQHGAETGVVGLVLLLALFAWIFMRLRGRPSRRAALGAAAVAALGVHATVDYILHWPVIPIVAAVLVGQAAATRKARPPEEDRAPERQLVSSSAR